MKKVLFVASVSEHIIAFHTPFLEMFQKNGYVTEVASNGEKEIAFCDVHYDVKFARNPLKKNNIKAYKQLKKIINDGEYDVVHCHTPVAAMLTRLSSRKARKKGTKVIYTAHGFHFYKGAPFLNWLVYFPVEWVCSFFTDTLILINKEDYAFAKKHMHAKNIEYVPGVGVDVEKIKTIQGDRIKKRDEIGISQKKTVVLSVGELNDNKNHETALKAIAKIKNDNIVYLICGKGIKADYLNALAKELGMEERFILGGFRNDIVEIMQASDIFVFPSKREGLPVSVMEAMVVGLPCVVSEIRGNVDLIQNENGGFLCKANDVDEFAKAIEFFADNEVTGKKMGEINKQKVEEFSLNNVKSIMKKIYNINKGIGYEK